MEVVKDYIYGSCGGSWSLVGRGMALQALFCERSNEPGRLYAVATVRVTTAVPSSRCSPHYDAGLTKRPKTTLA